MPAASPAPVRAPEKARWSARRYVRLAPRDIVVFKFLLEAYDNLAVMSIVDSHAAVVQVYYAREQEPEVLRALDAIAAEVAFSLLEPPPRP